MEISLTSVSSVLSSVSVSLRFYTDVCFTAITTSKWEVFDLPEESEKSGER